MSIFKRGAAYRTFIRYLMCFDGSNTRISNKKSLRGHVCCKHGINEQINKTPVKAVLSTISTGKVVCGFRTQPGFHGNHLH